MFFKCLDRTEKMRSGCCGGRSGAIFSRAALIAAVAFAGCVGPGRVDDGVYCTRSELPRLEALAFDVNGDAIYGQILVPSSKFGEGRPCAIICHGFAGFTRWDDVAHDLCRAGIVVVIPHHRGAWGSEGEYKVTNCIEDAANLARWAMGEEFAAKFGSATNEVYLVGHSMGGNSALNAAAALPGVRGVALIAACDIGNMAQGMTREALHDFLVGEGLHVLRRESDDAVVDDIEANAERMRFVNFGNAFDGRKVFIATGDYDNVVPSDSINALGEMLTPRCAAFVRKTYRAEHSLLGFRRELTADLLDFIGEK